MDDPKGEDLATVIAEIRERVRARNTNGTSGAIPLPDLMPLLHARDSAGPLAQSQSRDTGRDGAGSDDQVLVFAEIELVHHSAHQVGVDLTAGCDQAGADFDDYSHAIETFWLSWNGIATAIKMGFRQDETLAGSSPHASFQFHQSLF